MGLPHIAMCLRIRGQLCKKDEDLQSLPELYLPRGEVSDRSRREGAPR